MREDLVHLRRCEAEAGVQRSGEELLKHARASSWRELLGVIQVSCPHATLQGHQGCDWQLLVDQRVIHPDEVHVGDVDAVERVQRLRVPAIDLVPKTMLATSNAPEDHTKWTCRVHRRNVPAVDTKPATRVRLGENIHGVRHMQD